MLRGRSLALWRCLSEARVFVFPALVLLAVTLPHLDQGDFRGDAGWYSAIGLQAWRSGSLWTLWAEPGQHYFNKPPVAFWIHGFVLWLTGPQLWAARLPSVLAALGCVLATVAIAREMAGRRAAVFSGVVLALSLEFFRRSREISLDMWQTLFLLLGVWCVVRGAITARHAFGAPARAAPAGWFLAAGAAIGMALLTKPLVALLFVPIVGVWLLWMGERRLIKWLGLTAAAAVAVGASWHLSMAWLHGNDFLAQYFGAEIGKRATGELQAGHDKPVRWWFYFEKIATLYWPWLIPAALGLIAWSRGEWASRGRGWHAAARLAVLWVGLWIVFLTIYPDRRDRYAIVLYPALAWLAGLWLAHAPWKHLRRIERNILRVGPVFAIVLGVGLALAPIRIQSPDAHWRELFAWMRAQGLSASDMWHAEIGGAQGARLYLEFGRWPQVLPDPRGPAAAQLAPGAHVLYHHRGGQAPHPEHASVFQSSNGDLVVIRLEGERPGQIR